MGNLWRVFESAGYLGQEDPSGSISDCPQDSWFQLREHRPFKICISGILYHSIWVLDMELK